MRKLFLTGTSAIGALAILVASAHAVTEGPDVVEAARGAVARFVASLDALDADAFVDCFAVDATIFYPQSSQPKRVQGRDAIRASIEFEFAEARGRFAAAGKTKPPFLDIEPLDMEVQVLDSSIAVVTWHVDRKTHGGRRTAVVQSRQGAWTIVSLHSSNMDYR